MNKIIGIDARFYGQAGPGRYIKNVLWGLEQIDKVTIYYVFLRQSGYENYHPESKNFIKVLADYKWYSWSEQIGFLFKILKYKLDLFYVPHFNIPVLYPFKIITAIPDLIMHKYSTEKGTTLPKPYFRFKKLVYKMVVSLAIKRSFRVIVPSEHVVADFVKNYPNINKEKYVIAYEGVDPVFFEEYNVDPDEVLKKYKVKKPFILYISSMYEHKNVLGLIQAYKILLKKYNVDYNLVLIGKPDKYSGEIVNMVNNENFQDRIYIPGAISPVNDKDSIAFRKSALFYVFPSFKEGFSLTPMEAQVYGLACAISDIPIHREVYKDTVVYFDPYNPEDIAEKIYSTMNNENLKKELIQKGSILCKNFSWIDTAKVHINVFEELLSK